MTNGLNVVADPRRWQLLTALAGSDRRVNELTAVLGEPQNLVSYHLKVLRDAGLVHARRSSHDGRDTYYRLDLDRCADVLAQAAAALDPSLQIVASTPLRMPKRAKPVRVLFLCTGNSARSQIAEALLAHHSGGRIEAASAGSKPKPLHPEAVRVMADYGIDISSKETKLLDRYLRRRFDAVVTLCDKVREVCPEFPGAPVAVHWSLPDPSLTGDFLGVTADIDRRVRQLIARLTTPGGLSS